MAKIKSKIYAEALYELCQETKDLDGLLQKFAALIVKQYGFGALAAIIRQFDQVYNQAAKAVDVQIITARKLDPGNLAKISAAIKKFKQVKQVFITEQIVPEVIGGLEILVADMKFDSTITNKLKLIKNNI